MDLMETNLTGRSVLLVEDDDSLRTLFAKILQREGLVVHVASSGDEALLAAERAGTVDLLITDLTMMPFNGSELARRLGLKVLFISGHSRETAGIPETSPFLRKPFDPDDLVAEVERLLGPTSA